MFYQQALFSLWSGLKHTPDITTHILLAAIGLQLVEKELASLHIPFHLLPGLPVEVLPPFVELEGAAAVVTDFSPLRVPLGWVESVAKAVPVPLYQVYIVCVCDCVCV